MTMLSDRNRSPSEIIARLERFRSVAIQIENGLEGDGFVWDGTEGFYNVGWAAQMGMTLLTRTQAEERGYRLKRGVKPVGWRYFTAPISKRCALYVLECQAVKNGK